MKKPKRSKEHTTLTETAALVVRELERIPGVARISPGEITSIRKSRGGERFCTIVYTAAGFEMIITGQSVQNVAVHTKSDTGAIVETLKARKKLRDFTFKERNRFPGT